MNRVHGEVSRGWGGAFLTMSEWLSIYATLFVESVVGQVEDRAELHV